MLDLEISPLEAVISQLFSTGSRCLRQERVDASYELMQLRKLVPSRTQSSVALALRWLDVHMSYRHAARHFRGKT